MNELDLLNSKVGGQTLAEMSAFSFLQYVANKLNGVKAFSASAVELTALVRMPPMSKEMSADRKIELLNKLAKLGIQIP